MELINHINIPSELFKGIYQTGSSVICNPPVENTDVDFIICTTEETKLHKCLVSGGFEQSCEDEEEYDMESEGFTCYRKANINLIVTDNYKWYLKWVVATKLAKKLNLLQKTQRVDLFKYILYAEL